MCTTTYYAVSCIHRIMPPRRDALPLIHLYPCLASLAIRCPTMRCLHPITQFPLWQPPAMPSHPHSLPHSLTRSFGISIASGVSLSHALITHSPNPHRSHSLHASQTSSCTRRTILHVSAAILRLYPLTPNKSRPPFSPLSPLTIPRYPLLPAARSHVERHTKTRRMRSPGAQRVSSLAPLTTLTGHLLRPRGQ